MAKRKFHHENLGAELRNFDPGQSIFDHKKRTPFAEPQQRPCAALIWKLNIDCFHSIFDYLSIDDLIAVGQTCHRLKCAAGVFVQENFKAKRKMCQNSAIFMDWTPRCVDIFSEYLNSIYIFGNSHTTYRFVSVNCTRFLGEIRLAHVDLTDYQVNCIKGHLSNIEIIELELCSIIKADFYEHLLQFCPKLKSLSVSRSSYDRDNGTIIGRDNQWLHRSYPMLEHLELTNLYELKQNELSAFFAANPKVRSFSTDAKSLILNRIQLGNTKIDRLAVEFHPRTINSEIEPLIMAHLFYNLLLELHECNVFRQLHLYITFLDHQNSLQRLFSLKPLTMLGGYINRIENPLAMLKELHVNIGSDVIDLEMLPEKVPNLERIHFSNAKSDHILPFLRSLIKLKQIKIDDLKDGLYLIDGALDLIALNNERKQLANAKKVTIYVNDAVFRATKWTNFELNLKWIELRRGESLEVNGLNSNSKFIRSF